jgi:tRNA U54 and U55 pseudouridine synthase Pus10
MSTWVFPWSRTARMLAALADGPMSTPEIAEELGLSVEQISPTVSRQVGKRIRIKTYAAVKPGDAQLYAVYELVTVRARNQPKPARMPRAEVYRRYRANKRGRVSSVFELGRA